jgi:hypothetical protein
MDNGSKSTNYYAVIFDFERDIFKRNNFSQLYLDEELRCIGVKSVKKAFLLGQTACRNVRDLNFEFQQSIHCEILRIFEEFDGLLRDGFWS